MTEALRGDGLWVMRDGLWAMGDAARAGEDEKRAPAEARKRGGAALGETGAERMVSRVWIPGPLPRKDTGQRGAGNTQETGYIRVRR